MGRNRPIRAKRNGRWKPAWLALLLAALLSLAPAVAVAAPVPEGSMAMDASCPMPGDDHAGLSMICAVAGGCVILPAVGPLPRPVVARPVVGAPPAVAMSVGWNQAPEPPPPRMSAT